MAHRCRATVALLGVLLALLLPAGPAQAASAGVTSAVGVADVTPAVRTLHREHPPLASPLDALAPTGDVPTTEVNDAHPLEVAPPSPSLSSRPDRSRGPPQG